MFVDNVKLVVLIFLIAGKKKKKKGFPRESILGLSAPVALLLSVAPLALWQPLHQYFFKIKCFIY